MTDPKWFAGWCRHHWHTPTARPARCCRCGTARVQAVGRHRRDQRCAWAGSAATQLFPVVTGPTRNGRP